MNFEELWPQARNSNEDFAVFARAYLEHKADQHSRYLSHFYQLSNSIRDQDKENYLFILKDLNSPKEFVQMDQVRWLYKLAHAYSLYLNFSLLEFNEAIRKIKSTYSYRKRHRWNTDWYTWRNTEFREKLGFTYKGEAKKEASRVNEWRKETGHFKDKAKAGGGYWRRGVKRQAKKEFNVKARRSANRKLESGDWEEIVHPHKPWID